MTILKFQEPAPVIAGRGRPSVVSSATGAALRANRGRWALVDLNPSTAHSWVRRNEGFETCRRTNKVLGEVETYLRYVGVPGAHDPAVDPKRTCEAALFAALRSGEWLTRNELGAVADHAGTKEVFPSVMRSLQDRGLLQWRRRVADVSDRSLTDYRLAP